MHLKKENERKGFVFWIHHADQCKKGGVGIRSQCQCRIHTASISVQVHILSLQKRSAAAVTPFRLRLWSLLAYSKHSPTYTTYAYYYILNPCFSFSPPPLHPNRIAWTFIRVHHVWYLAITIIIIIKYSHLKRSRVRVYVYSSRQRKL